MDSLPLIILSLLLLLLHCHTCAGRLLHHDGVSPNYVTDQYVDNSKMLGSSNAQDVESIQKEADNVDTLLKDEANKQGVITNKHTVLLTRTDAVQVNRDSSELCNDMKDLLKWEDVEQKFQEMTTKVNTMQSSSAVVKDLKDHLRKLRVSMTDLQGKQKELLESVEETLTTNGWIGQQLQPIQKIADKAHEELHLEDADQNKVRTVHKIVVKAHAEALQLSDVEITRLAMYVKSQEEFNSRWETIGTLLKDAQDGLRPLPSFAKVTQLREKVEESRRSKEKLKVCAKQLVESIEETMTTEWYVEQALRLDVRAFELVFDRMDAQKGEMEEVLRKVNAGKALGWEEKEKLQKYVEEFEPQLQNCKPNMESMREIAKEVGGRWRETLRKLDGRLESHEELVKLIKGALSGKKGA